jgi:chemotaxis protein CheD
MIVANQRSINVGLGELIITKDTSIILSCSGLGSCIALCIYDPSLKLGGLAHMLLPSCRSKNDNGSVPSKYIDTGAPLLISRMMNQGSLKESLIVKIAGGAKMLSIPGDHDHLDIGQKNIAEIRATLSRENVPICGADTGGGFGRTIHFFLDTGKVVVKAVSGRIIEL